jgi:hypothetical protein
VIAASARIAVPANAASFNEASEVPHGAPPAHHLTRPRRSLLPSAKPTAGAPSSQPRIGHFRRIPDSPSLGADRCVHIQ